MPFRDSILALPLICLLMPAAQESSQGRRHLPPANATLTEEKVYRGSEVAPPVLEYKVEPAYAERARQARIEGTVILSIEVNSEGKVQNPRVVKSLVRDLDEQAILAVSQWRFRPGTRYGKPVTVAVTVEINFRLLDAPPGKAADLPVAIPPEQQSHAPAVKTIEKAEPQVKGSSQTGKEDVDFFGTPQTSLSGPADRLRLRSMNFLLISDWKQTNQLGQALLALERARALFLHLYGKVPQSEVQVVVNQSLEETRSQCRTSQVLGCYSPRTGIHAIILSKDAFASGTTAPAVHEYTHVVQNLMGYAWAPPWVNEGIARYYENIEFKKGKLYVGYFDPRQRIPAWLPIDSILTLTYDTLRKHSTLKTGQSFYAQSHLLVHMMRHTPKYSARLGEFFGSLKTGKESRQAFQDFYGVSVDQLNDELVEYYRHAKGRQVEVYEGITVPDSITVDGSGQKVTVKQKKCTWCSVGKVLRHVPIIIPL